MLADPNNNPGSRIQGAGVKTGVNLNAFSYTFLGHIGDSGRNQYYGPNYTDADMVLLKNVRLSGRFRDANPLRVLQPIQSPAVSSAGNVIENPGTFGLSAQTLTRPDGTTSARQIQLALKLNS